MSDPVHYARVAPRAGGWFIVGLIGRILVALVFLLAAYGKIRAPMKFAEEIQSYELVPAAATNAMALIIPWSELLLAVLLISGIWRREARWLTLAMLVVFTGAKVYAEFWDLNIVCGCFGGVLGSFEKMVSGPWGILLNLVLIGLLVLDEIAHRRSGRG